MPYSDLKSQTTDETALLLTQLTRIGVAIDKELTLMSERMTWLVMSESFIFSAFTLAAVNREKSFLVELLVILLPLVGFLLALTVYPALLAAHRTAKGLKEERHRFELKVPEELRVTLHAPQWEHFLGSVPAFVIPVTLLVVWMVIIVAIVLVPGISGNHEKTRLEEDSYHAQTSAGRGGSDWVTADRLRLASNEWKSDDAMGQPIQDPGVACVRSGLTAKRTSDLELIAAAERRHGLPNWQDA